MSGQTTQTGQLNPEQILGDRYIILKVLGRGGMGAVYLALDQRLNSALVAVKEMSTQALGLGNVEEAVKAFKKEAEMLVSLNHPSLPRIIDFFPVSDGRWYFVMEFIEGENLESIRKTRGSIPADEVLDWGIQLCEILDYLHTRPTPVIFRDLKPSNIILTPEGKIKLIDFGIARHFSAVKTKDTMAYGSYGFIPPEQYGSNQTDARSDLFSLGATLHYLVTGIEPHKNPFSFEPPSKFVTINPRFEAVIMECLALQVETRPSSARNLLERLKEIKYGTQPLVPNLKPRKVLPLPTDNIPTQLISNQNLNKEVQKKTKPVMVASTVLLSLALFITGVVWAGSIDPLGKLSANIIPSEQNLRPSEPKEDIQAPESSVNQQIPESDESLQTPESNDSQQPPDSNDNLQPPESEETNSNQDNEVTSPEQSYDTVTIQNEAEAFLWENWIIPLSLETLPQYMDSYAENVNYYNHGLVSRDFIKNDKAKALYQYPDFELSTDKIDMQVVSQDTVIATFRKHWDASGNDVISGEVLQELTLTKTEGNWKITLEKELEVYEVYKNGVRVQ